LKGEALVQQKQSDFSVWSGPRKGFFVEKFLG